MLFWLIEILFSYEKTIQFLREQNILMQNMNCLDCDSTYVEKLSL